nr:TonB-dependent receptor [Sphingomonas sp. CDS-1]
MKKICSSASLVALALASPALAQTGDAPAAQAGAPAQADGSSLADIIVTANRREENMQNVPISILAVTPAQLTNSGVGNLQDLAAVVPGLSVSQGAATANTYIRGVGSQVIGPGLESPVALYVDGVYYASTFGAPADLANVERVEVLKGPQGTLFGRNATGGLTQIVTRTPGQTPHIEANASYSNYDTTKFDGYASTGLGPNLAADISASLSNQRDGYGVNLVNGKDVNRTGRNLQLRSKWVFTPQDGTKLTAIFDYGEVRTSRNVFRVLPGTGLPPILGPNYGGSRYDTASNVDPFIHTKGGGASLKVEQDLGFADLINIVAYRRGKTRAALDLDATATVFTAVSPLVQKDRELTEELQLQSKSSGAFKWILGGYYYHDVASIDQTTTLGPQVRPPFSALRNEGEQTAESLAGFGQGTLELGQNTNLTVGARYTWEKRDLTANGFARVGANFLPTVSNFRDSTSFSRVTYRAAIDHRFSREVLVYAAVNSGFKSGGYNAVAPTQPPFRPEKLMSYSAGVKTDLLDRRLRINMEAFYYDYSDLQLAVVLVLAPGVTSPGVINGGKSRVYGLDLDLAAKVTDALTISGGFEYLHSRFTSSANNFAIGSPSGTVPTFLGSVKGNDLPYSPDFVGNISADYAFDLAGGKTNLNLTYQYNSGYFTEPDNIVSQRRFSLLNASLRWKSPGDHYSVSVWGKNLTNASVVQNELTLGFGPHYSSYLAPRTYGVTVGFNF